MTVNTPRASDRWIPWMLVGLMVSLVIAPLGMVVAAIKTFPGTTTEHAYEKGLAYNKAISAGAAQQALGWSLKLRLEAGQSQHVVLHLDARDASGKVLDKAKVTFQMVRPTKSGLDQIGELIEVGAGHYQKELALPLSGNWDARVSVVRNEQVAQTTQRFDVP